MIEGTSAWLLCSFNTYACLLSGWMIATRLLVVPRSIPTIISSFCKLPVAMLIAIFAILSDFADCKATACTSMLIDSRRIHAYALFMKTLNLAMHQTSKARKYILVFFISFAVLIGSSYNTYLS